MKIGNDAGCRLNTQLLGTLLEERAGAANLPQDLTEAVAARSDAAPQDAAVPSPDPGSADAPPSIDIVV